MSENYVTQKQLDSSLDRVSKKITDDISGVLDVMMERIDDRFTKLEDRVTKLEKSHDKLITTIDGSL